MSTLTPLRTRYNEVFSHLQQEIELVESLFCNVLEIPDCSWAHVTDELNVLRCKDFQEFDIIYEFYNYLDGLRGNMDGDECDEIRSVPQIDTA